MADASQGWSDDRVEILKALWAEGLSASQIAGRLGGITRNAVIGKVHRLGLAGRARAVPAAAPAPAQPVVAAPAPRPKIARPAEVPAELPQAPIAPFVQAFAAVVPQAAALPEPAEAERVTIMDLREFMCRWPLGDPTTAEFRFCGARAITGLPYCTHHARIAYQPAADRRRDRGVGGLRRA